MKKLIIILVSFISVVARSDMALGKMASSYAHQISEVIAQLKNGDDKASLEMSILAQDLFEVKEIYSYSSKSSTIGMENIVQSIRGSMASDGKWTKQLPAEKMKKLELNKSLFSKTFGEDSYEWAWIQNQLGDKNSAKKILSDLFNKEQAAVMSRKEVVFGLGRSPLAGIEQSYEALSSLSDDKEKKELDVKMNKVKKHISSLPQSHIMT